MALSFKQAVKSQAKLRMSIAGPSGSGKTYTGLAIATHLVPGGRIALVDTEHGSASKYADVFRFDVLELEPPYHPDRYVEAIQAAEEAGYDVLILDSLSHAWQGTGGLLEIVDNIAARTRSKSTFYAWKEATPIQNRLIDTIIGSRLHVIATLRSKQEYVVDRNAQGETEIRKVGLAPVQREGVEYEADIFVEMDMNNKMIVQKTRCSALAKKVIPTPGENVAKVLREWLAAGPAQPAEPAISAARSEAEKATEAATTSAESSSRTATGPVTRRQQASHVQAPELGHLPEGPEPDEPPTLEAVVASAERAQQAAAAVAEAERRTGVPVTQGVAPTKDDPRPWTAQQVIAALRLAAARIASEQPEAKANGTFGAVIGLMDEIGTQQRHSFIVHVFGVDSARKLSEPQKVALAKWAKPSKPDGAGVKWETENPWFAEELRRVATYMGDPEQERLPF